MIFNFDKVLTKELILSKVSEEEIFTRFGIPVEDGVFRSPMRTDKHPTCNFYRRRNGRLYLRDHAGYFWGDCFDFVIHQHRGISFGKALQIVANEFKLTDDIVLRDRIPSRENVFIAPVEACDIRVKRREWNADDARYWGRWKFKRETLEFYHISPLERVWINDEPIYAYRKKGEEAYCYHFGQYDYKVYFPYRDQSRFRHNNSWLLQGYMQLPATGEYIVLTKSLKDCAKLYEFGIPACAPMSETTLPSPAHMEELAERFGRIIVFYDNDWPGKRQMIKLARRYSEKFQLDLILMPSGYPKDFTDYFEKRGEERTKDLIEHAKSELNL